MFFGNNGLNKPICFGLVLFSFIVCLCIVGFQISQNGLIVPSAPDILSVVSNRIQNCSQTKFVTKDKIVEKIVEKPLNWETTWVNSKHGWRQFWTVFFANKNSR